MDRTASTRPTPCSSSCTHLQVAICASSHQGSVAIVTLGSIHTDTRGSTQLSDHLQVAPRASPHRGRLAIPRAPPVHPRPPGQQEAHTLQVTRPSCVDQPCPPLRALPRLILMASHSCSSYLNTRDTSWSLRMSCQYPSQARRVAISIRSASLCTPASSSWAM